MQFIIKKLSEEFNVSTARLQNVIDLLDEGATVPFIARYRKEVTGGLTDIQLRDIYERLNYLKNLKERKVTVKSAIEEQEKLTKDLEAKIDKAETLTEVEDLYRPYKQKRKTRASKAIEKGLKPLAEEIFNGLFSGDLNEFAATFIDEEKDLKSVEDALAGAMDIISEWISDEAKFRKWIRNELLKNAFIETTGSSEDRTQYEMYYEYKEKIDRIAPHRILAINRGEKDKVLNVKIVGQEEVILNFLRKNLLKKNDITDPYIELALTDGYKRLIFPSIEREIRNYLWEIGENSAIDVFKRNLKALLLQAPIKGKRVLGFDPGFRNGCKLAVLDDTGKMVDSAIIHVTAASKNKVLEDKNLLKKILLDNDVEVVSLGNGTASRESEEIICDLIDEIKKETGKEIFYVIVSEAGASIYSASKMASEEYPDIDVSIRGAISIGRRLQDPLAELVKIDPKSIGVGQYQHDVNEKKLNESLTGVVEDAVNNVGVDLNVATPALLSYISGITPVIANNIVKYREENGKFKGRKELLKVGRLGPKAYEQCAGFMRVFESKEVLDNTAIHPESYEGTKKLLKLLEFTEKDIKDNNIELIEEKLKLYGEARASEETGLGIETLKDIIKEIKKPGRDPREDMPKPILKSGVIDMEQLTEGMILKGTVRNVADFGAFVDIGVHVDGLVHRSQMRNSFVKHPLDVVQVGDIVDVKVIEIDKERGRISLTMKDLNN